MNLYSRILLTLLLLVAADVQAQRAADYQYSHLQVGLNLYDFSYDVPQAKLRRSLGRPVAFLSHGESGAIQYYFGQNGVDPTGVFADSNGRYDARLYGYGGRRFGGVRRSFLPPGQHGHLTLNPLVYRYPSSTKKICFVSWAMDSAIAGQTQDQLYLYANVWNEVANRYETRFGAANVPSVNPAVSPAVQYVLHENGNDVWVVLTYTDIASGDRKAQVWLLTETGFTGSPAQSLFRQTDDRYFGPSASLDGSRWAFIDDTKLYTYTFNKATGSLELQRSVDGGSRLLERVPYYQVGVHTTQLFAMASDNRTLVYLSNPVSGQEFEVCAIDMDAAVPSSRVVSTRGGLNSSIFQPPFCAPNGHVYWVTCDDPNFQTPITLMEARLDPRRASGFSVRSFVPAPSRHRVALEAPNETYNTAIRVSQQAALLGYPFKQRTSASLFISTNGLKESVVGASVGLPASVEGAHFRYAFNSRFETIDTSMVGIETAFFAGRRTVHAWVYDSSGRELVHDSAVVVLDSIRSSNRLSYIRSGAESLLGFGPMTALCGTDTIVDTLTIKSRFGVVVGQGFAGLLDEDSILVMKVPASRYAPHSFEPDMLFANTFAGASIWDTFQDSIRIPRPFVSGLCPGDSVTIDLGIGAGWHARYEWQGRASTNLVTVTGPGIYQYAIDYSSFCTPNRDSLVVPRAPGCVTALLHQAQQGIVNNVVTANADGINDRLELPGYGSAGLEVYNRWSQKVYATERYSNEWPTAETQAGVYFYQYTRLGKRYTGWVEVVR